MKTTKFYLLLIAVISTAFLMTSSVNGQTYQKDADIEMMAKEDGVVQLKIAGAGNIYGAYFYRNEVSTTECYIDIDDGTDYYWTCDAGTCSLQGYNWTIIDYNAIMRGEVQVACVYYDKNGEKQVVVRHFSTLELIPG